jgi:hypothetical protein
VASIEIRRRPVTGHPVHFGGHVHEQAATDYIVDAASKLGPVAYSMLRAAAFSLQSHRGVRLLAAIRGSEAAAKKAREIWKIDQERGSRYWRMNGRLYLWDFVQILHEVCEDLAGTFEAVSRCEADASLDLGLELLKYHGAADEVIGSEAFGNEAWWRSELEIDADPARYAVLTADQQSVLNQTLRVAEARLSVALSTVRSSYTHALHRVAARNRHGMALLEPDQALAWVDKRDAKGRADIEALASGALAVADTEGRAIVELLMPNSTEVRDELMKCLNEANWLFQSLCNCLLQRAESPAGVSIPDVGRNPTSVPEQKARMELTVAYCGYDPDDYARQKALVEETDAVRARVEKGEMSSRAQRRHPPREGKGRGGGRH